MAGKNGDTGSSVKAIGSGREKSDVEKSIDRIEQIRQYQAIQSRRANKTNPNKEGEQNKDSTRETEKIASGKENKEQTSTHRVVDDNYKEAARARLRRIIRAEEAMQPGEKVFYEMLGGRSARMQAGAAGHSANNDYEEGRRNNSRLTHQIIDISEEWRERMFAETKRNYIENNGVSNSLNEDNERRKELIEEFRQSLFPDERQPGTYTLEQYEQAYEMAFYNAVKAVNPVWVVGQHFDATILDKVSRKGVENTLKKVEGAYGTTLENKTIDIVT